MGIERRKHKRSELKVSIQMIRIDNMENEKEEFIPVDIFDLSIDGLGFKSDRELQLNSHYNVKFEIWTKETLNTIIKVVRTAKEDGIYSYGATFVGMTDTERFRVEVYQLFDENEDL